MSLRARKPVVLAFILGALALGAIMVVAFGGREIVSRHESFLLYFNDTVNGLDTGSAVRFKGVPIGVVQSVRLGFMPKTNDRRVPVVIRLNADRLQNQLGLLDDLTDPAVLAHQVSRGLRAQLQNDHYATGTMFVELQYHPQAPAPAPIAPSIDDLPEIPTIPSNAVAGLQKVQAIALWLPTYDFRAELSHVGDYIDSLTTKVSVIPYAEYHQHAVDALTPLANFNLGPAQRNITNFLTRLSTYQDSLSLATNQFSASAQDFVGMNHEARADLSQTDDTLAGLRASLRPAAPWFAHFNHNLQALSADMANLTAKLNATEQQPDVLPKIPK